MKQKGWAGKGLHDRKSSRNNHILRNDGFFGFFNVDVLPHNSDILTLIYILYYYNNLTYSLLYIIQITVTVSSEMDA